MATESKRRSIWSGALSFGLVNVPVRLFTAIVSHDIHFHEYQEKTGQRIHHKRVAEKSGKEVPYQQIVKGYEVGRGKVVTLEPEEVDSIEPRKTKTIEIEQFVELTSIDPIVWDATYYIGPSDSAGAGKSYALLLRAMEDTGRVGIGRFVMRTKEYLVTVRPLGNGLVLETMHYPDEIREQSEVGAVAPRVSVAPRELALARQLIDSLSEDWKHARFKDTYRDRMEALIARKAKGQKIEVEEAPEEEGKVVDLMEALKASLGSSDGKRPARREAGGSDRRRGGSAPPGPKARAGRQQARAKEKAKGPVKAKRDGSRRAA